MSCAKASASTSWGMASTTSVTRMIVSDSQPPRKPAIRPSGTPISMATETTVSAMASAPRAPRMTREKMSRPRLSVPKRKSALGGFRRRARCEAAASPG